MVATRTRSTAAWICFLGEIGGKFPRIYPFLTGRMGHDGSQHARKSDQFTDQVKIDRVVHKGDFDKNLVNSATMVAASISCSLWTSPETTGRLLALEVNGKRTDQNPGTSTFVTIKLKFKVISLVLLLAIFPDLCP